MASPCSSCRTSFSSSYDASERTTRASRVMELLDRARSIPIVCARCPSDALRPVRSSIAVSMMGASKRLITSISPSSVSDTLSSSPIATSMSETVNVSALPDTRASKWRPPVNVTGRSNSVATDCGRWDSSCRSAVSPLNHSSSANGSRFTFPSAAIRRCGKLPASIWNESTIRLSSSMCMASLRFALPTSVRRSRRRRARLSGGSSSKPVRSASMCVDPSGAAKMRVFPVTAISHPSASVTVAAKSSSARLPASPRTDARATIRSTFSSPSGSILSSTVRSEIETTVCRSTSCNRLRSPMVPCICTRVAPVPRIRTVIASRRTERASPVRRLSNMNERIFGTSGQNGLTTLSSSVERAVTVRSMPSPSNGAPTTPVTSSWT